VCVVEPVTPSTAPNLIDQAQSISQGQRLLGGIESMALSLQPSILPHKLHYQDREPLEFGHPPTRYVAGAAVPEVALSLSRAIPSHLSSEE
jgi:hypothetical protein